MTLKALLQVPLAVMITWERWLCSGAACKLGMALQEGTPLLGVASQGTAAWSSPK